MSSTAVVNFINEGPAGFQGPGARLPAALQGADTQLPFRDADPAQAQQALTRIFRALRDPFPGRYHSFLNCDRILRAQIE